MYTCVICNGVNHPTAFSCHYCGTVPAKYSYTGKPASFNNDIEVVVARGAVRAAQHHQRLFLRTVAHDYYASE